MQTLYYGIFCLQKSFAVLYQFLVIYISFCGQMIYPTPPSAHTMSPSGSDNFSSPGMQQVLDKHPVIFLGYPVKLTNYSNNNFVVFKTARDVRSGEAGEALPHLSNCRTSALKNSNTKKNNLLHFKMIVINQITGSRLSTI